MGKKSGILFFFIVPIGFYVCNLKVNELRTLNPNYDGSIYGVLNAIPFFVYGVSKIVNKKYAYLDALGILLLAILVIVPWHANPEKIDLMDLFCPLALGVFAFNFLFSIFGLILAISKKVGNRDTGANNEFV